MKYARLVADGGAVALESSYDPYLVMELKRRIPAPCRRFDGRTKRWLIDPRYAAQAASVVEDTLGIVCPAPFVPTFALDETRLLRVDYLGRCKDRGGESTASGWVDGGWNSIWPEKVLRRWFGEADEEGAPTAQRTLFGVLGIPETASPDELKKAYRRLAKTWHPDVCRESDAHEQFKAINHAYEVLNDPLTRKKYVAGLRLQATTAGRNKDASHPHLRADGYRSGLRAGWILARGHLSLGQFVATEILQWEDVTDSKGRVWTPSWPTGATQFTGVWQ